MQLDEPDTCNRLHPKYIFFLLDPSKTGKSVLMTAKGWG